MIILITLGYIGCVYAAFNIIKISVTAKSVAIAVVTGVIILGSVIISWNMSAPMTGKMIVHRAVVPLSSNANTKEVITKVHVKMDQLVKKGDPLYEVDPGPSQFVVDKATAQLAEAENNILALESALVVSGAKLEQAKANQQTQKIALDVATRVKKGDPGAVSRLSFEKARLSYESSHAAVDAAVASQTQAEYALASARNALPASQASLRTAQLDHSRAVIRAPANGYIANWQASVGTMTTTVITSAQGTFVDMDSTVVIAVFRQNVLRYVEPGNVVEIAFKSFPNRISTGTVEAVLEYTGEGQLMSEGKIPEVNTLGSKGFLAVKIILDDDAVARELPLGGAGTTAIYTDFGGPFHAITKIALHIKSLLYNLPL
jgi:multidrug resistance efflux pump